MISVYCDGSSTGRANKPGGWAFVVLCEGQPVACGYGGHPTTTNNVMELRAAIAGLEKAKELGYSEGITLFSDSQYVLGLANGIYSAQKNVLLAIHLRKLALELGISTQWVKGHSGNPWNDRCDSLAKRGKEENAKSSQRASSAEGQQQQASVGSGNQ